MSETTCKSSSASQWLCPTLPLAFSSASGFKGSNVTVIFSKRFHTGSVDPLVLNSAHVAHFQLEGRGEDAIIDGDYNQTLMTIEGDAVVTISNVVFQNGYLDPEKKNPRASVTVRLNNVMLFQNCTFLSNNASDGGAVFLYHGTTTFKRCLFINNTAYGGGDGGSHDTGGGGGIFNDHGKCILESSTFDSNVATGPA